MFNKFLISFVTLATLCFGKCFSIETITPGVLKVAVTDIPKEGDNAPGWTLDFLRLFEKTYGSAIEYVVVPFDKSWELPACDQVDVVATGVTCMESRKTEGVTSSKPYLQVKRALRIHNDEKHLFHTIDDFIGYRVGAVKGMTSLFDLENRAPSGVEIVVFDDWDTMYESFYNREINAVSEGYFFSLNTLINHKDTLYPMIDDHDLEEDKPEFLVFPIRDKSEGVLSAFNDLLEKVGFPIRTNWKTV